MAGHTSRYPSLFNVVIGIGLLASASACSHGPILQSTGTSPPECQLLEYMPTGQSKDTAVVALRADPGVGRRRTEPFAGTRFETNIYETLIAVDCLGDVRPGLADYWQGQLGGRRWSFRLREGAEFWDRSPVTASDVVQSWLGSSGPMSNVDSVHVVGDRIITVSLKRPSNEVPIFFSDLRLAVTKKAEGVAWPVGSGPYQIVAMDDSGKTNAVPVTSEMQSSENRSSVLEFSSYPGKDPRDLLDQTVDVLVTVDPAAIEYARDNADLRVEPLPWNQTYVLISPTRVAAMVSGQNLPSVPKAITDALARDAVRASARGYLATSWWEVSDVDSSIASLSAPSCASNGGPDAVSSQFPAMRPGAQSILYDSSDEVARNLAERLVSLAATGTAGVQQILEGPSGLVAEALDTDQLDERLTDGNDFAYVIALPRRPTDTCGALNALRNRVPWLAAGRDGLVGLSSSLVPLIDTRPHIIARPTGFGVEVDWYGNVLIATGDVLSERDARRTDRMEDRR